jgi:hypothetical protein
MPLSGKKTRRCVPSAGNVEKKARIRMTDANAGIIVGIEEIEGIEETGETEETAKTEETAATERTVETEADETVRIAVIERIDLNVVREAIVAKEASAGAVATRTENEQ